MNQTLQAKPVINDKFWVVENNGEKLGTLRKNDDDRFILSDMSGVKVFNNKESLTTQYGKDFFIVQIVKPANNAPSKEVQGFPTCTTPHNLMYDIQKKLPLFTKTKESRCIFCAGYYVIHFNKGWVKSFCPKLITLQRNEFKGPFKTEQEMKKILSYVSN